MRGRIDGISGWFNSRFSAALSLCAAGLFLAGVGLSASDFRQPNPRKSNVQPKRAEKISPPLTANRPITPRDFDPSEPPWIELFGVTCVSESDCWAVGTRRSHTFTEHWDGTSWTFVFSPDIDPAHNHHELLAVTCNSATDCWAVGARSDLTSPAIYTLIEHWNGTSWSIVDSPNAPSTVHNRLNSVTCSSASDCWAVGYSTVSGGVSTLIQHWDGNTWTIVSSPNRASAIYSSLSGVACRSGSDCSAVGHSKVSASSKERTLIEHWNGTTWEIVSSVDPDPGTCLLNSIACPSPPLCWAAGYVHDGNGFVTLIEKWDGSSWTWVYPPDVGKESNFGQSIACNSAADCWIVGHHDDEGRFIAHLNGTSGAGTVFASGSRPPDRFNGVACGSASSCWAVGGGFFSGAAHIEHWNGTSWKQYPVESIVRIDAINRSANFVMMIDGHGPPNMLVELDAAADLSSYADTVATVMTDANGAFHIEDTTGEPGPERFYRVVLQ
ncbi:MAG TPA: hypothetical protein VJ719_12725 [Chthoniobacterales bacterium]|nr:hypothetical protein [Chthoniobacterales bacterium]